MGNVCKNDVLRAELSGMMGLKSPPWHDMDMKIKDAQATSSTFHHGVTTATFREQAKLPPANGPAPTDGYYLEMPALLPAVSQRLQQVITLKEPSNIYNRQFHGPFRFFEVEMVYMGEWQLGKPDGKGRAYYSDGSVYEGEFSKGVPMGHGKYVITNGDYYEGDVHSGRAHGKGCYITSTSMFQGKFVNDMREGWGVEQTSDYHFEGTFKSGERVSGTLTWGQYKYVGDFLNDQFQGKGSITTQQGTYTGDFSEGKKHGFGVFIWQDGTTYRGCYQHDYRHGEGIYQSPTGQILSVVAQIDI